MSSFSYGNCRVVEEPVFRAGSWQGCVFGSESRGLAPQWPPIPLNAMFLGFFFSSLFFDLPDVFIETKEICRSLHLIRNVFNMILGMTDRYTIEVDSRDTSPFTPVSAMNLLGVQGSLLPTSLPLEGRAPHAELR